MIHFVLHEAKDTVAVAVVEGITAGTDLTAWIMDDDKQIPIKALQDIPIGHKIALKDMAVGDTVWKYGIDMGKVVERWEDDADLLKLGPGALLHGLLDVVVDGHFETVQLMDDAIESLEDGLFDETAVTRQIQQRTYRVRKELVQMRRVILPMREVVNEIQHHRAEGNGHRSELDGWYADLYDHVLRASEWTESLRDMVTTVFETNLSLQEARLNTVMKKLTGWAAIIAVPTAVTGWFGQNVPYPGFARPAGLYASAFVIILMAGTLYVVFKRRNWL